MANSNFYDELDLRYPEIAVCLDVIDRTNPGTRNFYIPVLTPNVDTSSLMIKTQTYHQNSSTIDNEDKINISNVEIQNYIPITIPKELCAFTGGDYNIVNINSIDIKTDGRITISGDTGYSGGTTHTHSTLEGYGTMKFEGQDTLYKGILNIVPTDEYRYIAKGSKWIVVFIGGDINKPQIIGRYIETTL